VHLAELSPPELRVLGCLIEKRFTTPDQYPLTLNALRLACNQSTNRDPVVHYDEDTVREAAQRLARYGLTRLASGHSSRAVKYRHMAEDVLGCDSAELAILCVLLLRGAQTPGELKGRTERMVPFESLDAVEAVLRSLGDKGYARRVERRPGQKEDRFEQLLGGADTDEVPSIAQAAPPQHDPVPPQHDPVPPQHDPVPPQHDPVPPARPVTAAEPVRDGLSARVDTLEAEVAALRAELRQLRELLD
jgi:uncharacterized protein YceH (UPF0502 family)